MKSIDRAVLRERYSGMKNHAGVMHPVAEVVLSLLDALDAAEAKLAKTKSALAKTLMYTGQLSVLASENEDIANLALRTGIAACEAERARAEAKIAEWKEAWFAQRESTGKYGAECWRLEKWLTVAEQIEAERDELREALRKLRDDLPHWVGVRDTIDALLAKTGGGKP